MSKRKRRKHEGFWELPRTVVKSLRLKTTPQQDKLLFEHYLEYRNFANFVKEGEARKKETKTPYDYVKKYRVKNKSCSAHWLGGCANTLVGAIIPSSIRGIILEHVAFPIRGKISPNTTSPDIKVTKVDGKYWLLFAKQMIEILYPENSDYYEKGIEKPLHMYWKESIFHGGWLVCKKGKWYWQAGVPRSPPIFKWNNDSKRVFMVIQPILSKYGIVWIAKFFDEQNQQRENMTLLHAKSTPRLLSKTKDYRTYYVRKAINKLFRIWHEGYSMFRPTVILLEAVGEAPTKEVRNINPTYKLGEKMKDKLAEVDGQGANLQDCPLDIAKIRSRLSL